MIVDVRGVLGSLHKGEGGGECGDEGGGCLVPDTHTNRSIDGLLIFISGFTTASTIAFAKRFCTWA